MDRDSHRMGLVAATAMSVTIVVGAGLLTLPGLSYAQAGRLGHLPWLLMSVLMLPLLAVFAFFARRHPSAGGVVGYIRLSLGPRPRGPRPPRGGGRRPVRGRVALKDNANIAANPREHSSILSR